MLFDTHCHLNSDRLRKDIKVFLERARSNGVELIMVPGIDGKDSRWALDNLWEYEGVYGAVGIHPSVEEDYRDFLKSDEFQVVMAKSATAIGETGLDRQYFEQVPFELQKERLVIQIQVARRLCKGLILHSRGTAKELLEILDKEWNEVLAGKVVFHCCEVDDELLKFAKEREVFIGIDGDVTYPAKQDGLTEKQNFVKKVPRKLLVLETDSPYLLPEPLRSEKKYPNEPANVNYVAEKVAELWETSVEEVGRVTTENAKRLFGL